MTAEIVILGQMQPNDRVLARATADLLWQGIKAVISASPDKCSIGIRADHAELRACASELAAIARRLARAAHT